MKYAVKLLSAGSVSLLLASCGTVDGVKDNVDNRLPRAQTYGTAADFPQKIGEPYQVAGTTYTPQDVGSYDEVGYASWYGQELSGNSTANGEPFNPEGITAAHKTLPLPTYVEVTALDTGRTILVRVNDRGPFANDRILDLSHGAAKQLGIDQQGVAGIRVRKVNPNEQEREVLRAGGAASERIATPDSLLSILRNNLAKLPRPAAAVRQASAPLASPPPRQPVSGNRQGRFIVEGAGRPTIAQSSIGNNYVGSGPGTYVVQVAAFSDKNRANAMARKIGAKVMPDGTRKIWRVRYGPYDSTKEAEAGLAQAKERGYSGARILNGDQ